MADVRTPELVINKLTKQQYENIQNPSATEIYLVPEDEEHKPICYHTTASEVTTTSMVVKSSVSDNGKIITERGFVYDTSPSPVITGNKLICDVGSGMMDGELDNLTQNTEYHIRSYGINASGLVYGSELVQRTTGSPIPAEYQLVEYLQSNGTQYILISQRLYGNTEVDITYKLNSISQNKALFGGRTYSAYWFFITGERNYRFDYFGTQLNNFSTNLNIEDNFKTIVSSNNNLQILQNGAIIVNIQLSNGVSCDSIILFNGYTSGTTLLGGISVQMQLAKFYRADDYDIQLYPVYRISDNKPGMYDIVNNVFYTNQGTGEFTVGPDKVWDE